MCSSYGGEPLDLLKLSCPPNVWARVIPVVPPENATVSVIHFMRMR